ncbi:rhomboid family intramembrane serine protease [Rubrivivax gelatinosus]|uniref:Membrane associated rhomboid family serine protease n=1 Tax=Rubrivivax gelatinosus TaxID=28068 RepID=A0A4R2MNR4_RUBGE|nr:rhomboid family intramembrane serine protease [Rubrivivax gelatinosus]MBK1686505.1 rhomboid family intramembrane serine protease [Rubrivivax gelatinosus]TCP00963.1 membrane associated rhomboid family serine protease [Rubrivivax gelatinosus]
MFGAPVATLLLLVIVVASAVALRWREDWLERGLLRPFWLTRRGQWGTVVSSAFLHADWPHLLFNAFTFWAFAFMLERRIGSGAFAALYAAGIVASAVGTWLQHRQDPAYRTLGASGAVLAVLFASILYFPSGSLYVFPLPVPLPAPLFALGYLAYTIWASRQDFGRVNHDAHLGGAVLGLAFVGITDPAAFAAALATWLG